MVAKPHSIWTLLVSDVDSQLPSKGYFLFLWEAEEAGPVRDLTTVDSVITDETVKVYAYNFPDKWHFLGESR